MIRLFKTCWQVRELIAELTRRELFQGHKSHLFGKFWVFLNPVITLLIYFFVFHFVFPARAVGSGSAEVFLLAGLVQWVILSDVLVRACSVLRQNANLVKQISFPVEALFMKNVLAALFLQLLMTAGLVVIAVFVGFAPGASGFALWCAAMLLQAAFMLGVGLALGSMAVFVPDVGELIGIVARLGLFATPILYASEQFGPQVARLFYANPFSYFAWIHQDALYAGAILHPGAWIGACILGFSALWAGIKIFSALSPAFTDAL